MPRKSNKIPFFRWEHTKSKIGPYNHAADSDLSKEFRKIAAMKKLPTPSMDDGFYMHDSYRCGFESIHSMNRWFSPEEQQKLLDNNFRLAEYRIDKRNIKLLRYQSVVFKLPKRAYRIIRGKRKW